MDPADYGRAVLFGDREPCENAAVQQLCELLARQGAEMTAEAGEQLFDAARNARGGLGAERYYRLMYCSGTESWNLRDRHMFDTLRALLQRRGPDAKAVVWVHNIAAMSAMQPQPKWAGPASSTSASSAAPPSARRQP
jgi:erythromycin esterase-like protein